LVTVNTKYIYPSVALYRMSNDDGVAEEMLANLMKSARKVCVSEEQEQQHTPLSKMFEEMVEDDNEMLEVADGDSISTAAEEEGIIDDD